MKVLQICAVLLAASLLPGCADSPAATAPTAASGGSAGTGTRIVRETLSATIGATESPACSAAFRQSVDASYFDGGTGRCMEFRRRASTAGIITARLTWRDVRLDLDLVLNDGIGSNFRQSIAANRCCETIEFFVNAGTDVVFVVHLRGVDPQFLANGGTHSGPVTTAFTLEVERPE
ncbi:MAG: hypothetical protein R2708_24280 [Vicinamibacterales bacterium]